VPYREDTEYGFPLGGRPVRRRNALPPWPRRHREAIRLLPIMCYLLGVTAIDGKVGAQPGWSGGTSGGRRRALVACSNA
jgi:hypothetical protein